MIKVAFLIDVSWIGGINYFRNLLFAIAQVKGRKIAPVIIVGKKADPELLKDLPNFQVIQTSILDVGSFWWRVNRRLGRNRLLIWLLKINRIKVLSHTEHVDLGGIKTIGWIPDFQHCHLPHLFSEADLNYRDIQFMKMAKFSTRVILSSEDARKDFDRFAPDQSHKARVLKFASIPAVDQVPDIETLQRKYQFYRPYFYIPNQFWTHKNHNVVVDALIALKTARPDALVISTGATKDYRNLSYFSELKNKIEIMGVAENFLILGVVPYRDVVGLLANALALINPSLFEGWSTSVEEAKSLGVPMFLSNIAVHIEQAGDIASFFPPADSTSLAKLMIDTLENKSSRQVIPLSFERISGNQSRLAKFGENYQEIVLDMMG